MSKDAAMSGNSAMSGNAAMFDNISRPVPYRDARITGGFWKAWQDTAAADTVAAVHGQYAKTGRFAAMSHDWREGEPNRPHIFYDSDVAKWMEGAAYSLFFRPDANVEAQIEELIDFIDAGMTKDGYFNSYYQTIEPHMRWTERANHELYCAGHLIEAAAAYFEATGKRRFLGLMERYAEYIYKVFVTDKSAAFATPGHEEIELALVRLWQCDGNPKWLELAKHFIDARGKDPSEKHLYNHLPWKGVAQDQAPVAEQDTAEGHVVRFGYLFAGAADIARETCDAALLEACRNVWKDAVTRKMYVTGGVGNMKHGEAFGPAYFLPNFDAYTETCASIALAFFGRRLSLIEPIGEYADICELELFNGALAGISLDGRRFFYENPLSMRPSDQRFFNGVGVSGRPVQRVEAFDCSCCPPNILRMLTSVSGWMYSVAYDGGSRAGADDDAVAGAGNTRCGDGNVCGALSVIYVHQYAQSEAKIALVSKAGLAGGASTTDGASPDLMSASASASASAPASAPAPELTLTQKTSYPWDGRIELAISAPVKFYATIALRAPGWCDADAVKLNFEATRSNGYLHITREWQNGDRITLDLPMDVVEIEANPYVSQDAGRVALKRGPLVYCVEGADNGDRLEDLLIPADASYEAEWDGGLLGGVCKLKFKALRRKDFDALYRKWAPEYEETDVTAIPYYAWGNRAEGEMAVWLRKQA